MLKLVSGRPRGLPKQAWAAFQKIGIPASRVVQTVGNAPDSRGTHSRDGFQINEFLLPEAYCGAVDISVLHPSPFTEAQIKTVLEELAFHGFAGFYRAPHQDGWNGSVHIHAIYCAVKLKDALKNQVHDWLNGKNGLVSHSDYQFWQASETDKNTVRAYFNKYNS